VFEQAQQILIARGDDHATLRAYVNSDYTLAGQITCVHCGKRYLGTAATGKLYRYRYYTCYTRQRYGADACPAERLPADQVEQAVLGALVDTYRRTDLIYEAVTAVAASIESMRDTYQAEVTAIDGELASIDAKTDRLISAIENGLNEGDAIERITEHRQRANQLRLRRNELAALTDGAPIGPTTDQLAVIIDGISQATTEAEPNAIKRLFEQLVHEVRVTGRSNIKPYFRIPLNGTIPDQGSGVRTLSGSVRPAGFEPATLGLEALAV